MRKLAKKLVLFFVINAVIVVLAASVPPSLLNEEYADVGVIFDFIESVEPGDRLNVILGDSRSELRVNARELGFVNLSFAGATPVEGFYVLDKLVERGAKIEKLIISYGPFHIFSQDTFHPRTRYFALIDSKFSEDVLAEAVELGDEQYLNYNWPALEVLDEHLFWLPNAIKLRMVNVLTIDETFSSVARAFIENYAAPRSAEAASGQVFEKLYSVGVPDFINTEPASPEAANPTAESPINERYLGRLVELARSRNMKLSYLVMPFNKDVAHPDAGYYDKYYSVLRSAGLAHCVNPAVWWPNELFIDSHHLNASGVARFNDGLAGRLSFCQ